MFLVPSQITVLAPTRTRKGVRSGFPTVYLIVISVTALMEEWTVVPSPLGMLHFFFPRKVYLLIIMDCPEIVNMAFHNAVDILATLTGVALVSSLSSTCTINVCRLKTSR